jgi:iron(III) transport system permease protein
MAEGHGAVRTEPLPLLRAGPRWPALQEPVVPALVIALWVGFGVCVLLPLAMVLKASLSSAEGALTLARYAELATSGGVLTPLGNSLLLAASVAVTGTTLGYLLAYLVTLTSLPFRRAFRALATLPMISPPFMVALAAIMLFGRNGAITRAWLEPWFGAAGIPSIYGYWGLLAVETLSYFPTAFLLLVSLFASIDPVLEEAAQNQGAGRFAVFRDVIFRLSIPGILSSALLIFIESLADFGNPLILSGDFKVLSVEAYLKITGQYDTAGGAVLAMLLLLPSVLAFLAQRHWVGRTSYATLSGKPSSSRRRRGSPGTRLATFLAASALVSGVLLFYGSVLYGSLVRVWGADETFTLANYSAALAGSWDALRDSLLLAALSTPVSGLLGMLVAYLLVRKRFPGRGAMELASMLSFAVPGTVIGIGYILAFNGPPFPLTGTAWIIVLLMIFRNAPLGIQSGMTAIRQVDRSIEEGSANLGAASLTTFRRIVLPLISAAFFSGLAHGFVRSMTAISAVIFVVSGQWNLVTVSILGFVENSQLSQASALCVVLVGLVFLVLGLLRLGLARLGGTAMGGAA